MEDQINPFMGEDSPFLGNPEVRSHQHRRWPAVQLCLQDAWSTYRCKMISVIAILLFLVSIFSAGLLIGHYAISYKDAGDISEKHEICSNPPLLLISMDGFRPSYLQRGVTPMLQELIGTGVRAEYMRSSFPTKTFPNHYSIVTGLYPESHGIVNNKFYDSELKDWFFYNKPSSATQSKWWGGEPVWVTAAKHGLHTAIFFWPGSEVSIKGVRPDIYFKYNYSIPFPVRVETVLAWMDLPKEKRPQFMALYFNQPDRAGHSSGPDSSEVAAALAEVDLAMQLLWDGLRERSISDCVNIMIVSDHGMAAYNASQFVNISNLVPADVNVTYDSLGVIANLDVSGGDEVVDRVYDSFVVNGTGQGLPFRVFMKNRLPFRLHTGYHNKQRYGPIYATADVHALMAIKNYRQFKGNHGYDNIEKEMQAIFIGHGPAFRKNYTVESFENIQLYSLMCDLLNIKEATNNGTYGALHAILDPKLSAKLPPPVSPKALPGTLKVCPFPQDVQVQRKRSICEDCVCRSGYCNITNDTILSSNKKLFDINSTQKDSYKSYHNPWGVPVGGYGDGACILSQLDYISLYSSTLKIPLWSTYTLDPEIVNGKMPLDKAASACWRHDPRVSISESTNCSTYLPENGNGSVEDGMLAVPFLFPVNSSQNLSMSVFTNIIFQSRSFNSKVWFTTLLKIEAWLKFYCTPLHVLLGVALDADRDGMRDRDSTYSDKHRGVAIPTHFFVVLTRCAVGGDLKACAVKNLKVMGILLQHPLEAGDYPDVERLLRSSLTPVRDIERLTGINFFPNLSAMDQNTLELRLLDQLWPTTT